MISSPASEIGPGPLVSIGVPVRNGALFLDEALWLLRNQSYPNLEIVVSDNASDDGSIEIIRCHAAKDNRVRVYRHSTTQTALANFQFVFEKSRGSYFMWAACDDRRSLDNVEYLVSTLEENPKASLAFGHVAQFSDFSQWRNSELLPYFFESLPGDTKNRKLSRYACINCLHIYGLIQRAALASYNWIDIDTGPDIPIIIHLALNGDFVRASGGVFYYYAPFEAKSPEERAIANSLRQIRAFPEVRLSWACAKVVASQTRGVRARLGALVTAFSVVYFSRMLLSVKPWVFERLPHFLVVFYRENIKGKF